MKIHLHFYVFTWNVKDDGTFDEDAVYVTTERHEDPSRVWVGDQEVVVTPYSVQKMVNETVTGLQELKQRVRKEMLEQFERIDERISTMLQLTHQPEEDVIEHDPD